MHRVIGRLLKIEYEGCSLQNESRRVLLRPYYVRAKTDGFQWLPCIVAGVPQFELFLRSSVQCWRTPELAIPFQFFERRNDSLPQILHSLIFFLEILPCFPFGFCHIVWIRMDSILSDLCTSEGRHKPKGVCPLQLLWKMELGEVGVCSDPSRIYSAISVFQPLVFASFGEKSWALNDWTLQRMSVASIFLYLNYL